MDPKVLFEAENLSPMEILYRYYADLSPIDSSPAEKNFAELESALQKLPTKEADSILHTVCRICEAQEHRAFEEGFRMGAQLTLGLFPKDIF